MMKACLSLTVGFLAVLPLPLHAKQPLEFSIRMYEGDSKILDALESRILAGGAPAVDAMKKVPEFVQSRRMTVRDQLEFEVISGQRTKKKSSEAMLEANQSDWKIVDGLEVEIDPVFVESKGTIDANLFLRWGRKEGRDVRFLELTTAVEGRSGEPVLLHRWTDEENDRMLILTATAPGITSTGSPEKLIYFDTTVYESEEDAQANRDPVARIMFPSTSGQRSRSTDAISLNYEAQGPGSDDIYNVGFTAEVDPILSADGTSVDLNAAVTFSKKGGTAKTADGHRIPEVAIRQAIGKATLKSGESKPIEMSKSILAVDPQGKPDKWRATFGVKLGHSGQTP